MSLHPPPSDGRPENPTLGDQCVQVLVRREVHSVTHGQPLQMDRRCPAWELGIVLLREELKEDQTIMLIFSSNNKISYHPKQTLIALAFELNARQIICSSGLVGNR